MGIVRKTKSVKKILDAFDSSTNALSVVELVSSLKDEMNKTTVYRALQRLEDEYLIHSFIGKDGLKWYAKCNNCCTHEHQDMHPHFQCKSCGKTECLDVQISIPTPKKYRIESTQLLMIGTCDDCQKKQK